MTTFSRTLLVSLALFAGCASTPPWAGMSQQEIAGWKGLDFLPTAAQAWHQKGFTPDTAGPWHAAGLSDHRTIRK